MAPSTGKSSKKAKFEKVSSAADDEQSERSTKRETYRSANVIEYKLSDQRFLDIGWTIRPSTRITKKIIQYRTRMAKPHANWFDLHRQTSTKYYDDLKTPFVAFHTNGSGQVFYPNGTLAITVNRPKKRTYDLYTVFTPEGADLMGHHIEPQMLAAFDGLGNGIVLNDNNDVRLTYNQIGGIFFDHKRSYAWTWSQKKIDFAIEPVDTDVPSARLEKLLQLFTAKCTKSSAGAKTPKSDKNHDKKEIVKSDTTKIVKTQDEISVEDLEDKADEIGKSKEILNPMKIICLRLNDFLSLRIVDRRNISLTFFRGNRSIRIELGTILNIQKPISSYTVDSSEGFRGLLKSRFQPEQLKESLTPEDSLYDISLEYRKTERIKRGRGRNCP